MDKTTTPTLFLDVDRNEQVFPNKFNSKRPAIMFAACLHFYFLHVLLTLVIPFICNNGSDVGSQR